MTDIFTNNSNANTASDGDNWSPATEVEVDGNLVNTWPQWSENRLPTSGEDVEIDGTATLTNFTGSTTIGNVTVAGSADTWTISQDSGAGAFTVTATGNLIDDGGVTVQSHGGTTLDVGGNATIGAHASLDLLTSTMTVTGNLTDNGSVGVDNFQGNPAASNLTVDKTLTVGTAGVFQLGNTGQTGTANVNVKAVTDDGSLEVFGDNFFNVHSAAGFNGKTGELFGNVVLGQPAAPGLGAGGMGGEILFDSGQITTIEAGATLQMSFGGAIMHLGADSNDRSDALDGLTEIDGQMTLNDAAPIDTTGSLTISKTGDVFMDNQDSPPGMYGSQIDVGGTLTVEGRLDIGSLAYTTLDEPVNVNGPIEPVVTATELTGVGTGTGNIFIEGGLEGTTTPIAATLDITGEAGIGGTAAIEGIASLSLESTAASGAALLEFGKDQISTIVNGVSVTLDGPNSFIADASDLTSNSALTGLATVAGELFLLDGATVADNTSLTVGSENSAAPGTLALDLFDASGGSSLTVKGNLTLAGTADGGAFLDIGNSGQTVDTHVTVSGELLGIGGSSVSLAGSTLQAGGQAVLEVGSIFAGQLENLLIGLSGNSLFELDNNGQISTIDQGAGLSIDGADAFVADKNAPTSNSALRNLSHVNGSLTLTDGAAVTTGSLTVGERAFVLLDNIAGDGGGSVLRVAGTLTLDDESTVNIGAAGLTKVENVTANAIVFAGSGSTPAIASVRDGLLRVLGTVTEASGATGGGVTIDAGGTVDLLGAVSAGSYTIAGGTLELGAGASGGGIGFQDGGDLIVGGTTMPTDPIFGFAAGDAILLPAVQFDPNYTVSTTSTTLTIGENGKSFQLLLNGASGENFVVAAAAGGSEILFADKWSGTGGWTENPSDWSLGAAPANIEAVDIASGTVTLDSATPVSVIAATIEASATLAVSGTAALTINGGVTNRGSLSVSGGSLTVTGGLTGSGTESVTGGSVVLNAGATSVANRVDITAGGGTVNLTGGSGNDVFAFTTAAFSAKDTVAGGAGTDTLEFTTAGTVAAASFAHVSGIDAIDLANGTDSMTLTNALVANSDAKKLTVDGGTGTDTVNGALVGAGTTVIFNGGTTAKTTYAAGAGTVQLTGGAGNDVFEFAATNLTAADIVHGGAGTDTLWFTTAGTVAAAAFTHVTGIDTIHLANGTNSLTLANAVVANSDAKKLTVDGGTGTDTVNGTSVSGGTVVFNGGTTAKTTYAAGAGTVELLGGAGNDVFEFAAANLTSADIVRGGAGTDTLFFTHPGTIAATAFAHVSGIDVIRLSGGTVTLSNALVANSDGDKITINGGTGDEAVFASAVAATGTIVFNGGGGADTIAGGKGDNIYDFNNIANATLSINNAFAGGTAAHGQLDFGAGITDETLWFEQSGNNLVADVIGTKEQVTIDNWFGANKSAQLSEIEAGGLKLDNQVQQLVQAMATYQQNNPGFDPTASGATMPNDPNLQSAIAAAWHH